MPTFGDYESVGEPLAVINLQGHISTVWKARKTGARDGRDFAVKSYAPHRRSKEGGHEESLDRDRGLEFLEGVKQLKKAQTKGARHLSPIHDLGISSEGAWYVTDYYPRSSLMALIERRAKVDSAALRQIIRCIVSGCLALKESRGVSHGNLKASNVFLVGKPRPLPKTPLLLADPYPAAPLQLARLEVDDRKTVGELLHQVMEVQDLRALGEIILQLVERRPVRSGYDYNYPIGRSEAWDNLGKDGERWRQICNQLLDPQLSLAEINLESLAKKFPLGVGAGKAVVSIAVIGAVCLLSAGGYYLTLAIQNWNKQHQMDRAKQSETAMSEATNHWVHANEYVKQAERNPALFDSALSEIEQALTECKKAHKLRALQNSEQLRVLLEAYKRSISEAKENSKRNLTKEQQYADAMAAVTNAMNQAQADYEAGRHDSALRRITSALNECAAARTLGAIAPVDELEKKLKSLQTAVQTAKTQSETKAQRYADAMAAVTNAMNRAQADYEAGRHDSALRQITNALNECATARTLGAVAPVDELEKKLKSLQTAVQTAKTQSETKAKQYADAMAAVTDAMNQAQADYEAGRHDSALRRITNALNECATARTLGAVAPVDELEKKLKSLQTAVQTAKTQSETKAKQYADAMAAMTDAMNQAQADYEAGRHDSALRRITSALNECATARTLGAIAPVDELEKKLKSLQTAVQTTKTQSETKAKQYADAMAAVTDAMNRAQADYEAGRHDSALRRITNALNECATARTLGAVAPVDELEKKLKSLQTAVQTTKDKNSAQDFFDQCQYEQVAALCAAHPDVEFFKYLAVTNRFESNQLAQMTTSFNSGDYSFVDGLGKAGYSTKRPFANLLSIAKKERDDLQQMQDLKNKNNWQGLLKKFSDLGAADFLSKRPFSDLKAWAEGQKNIAQTEAQEKLQALDTELEILCIELGVSKPPWLKMQIPPTVRPITTDIELDKKDEISKQIDGLERGYKEGGWFTLSNRDQYINKLKKNLANR